MPALDYEGVQADLYTLGQGAGGGILPVSAVVGRRAVLGVLRPGEHGSTFGGNPLACAVGRAVIALLASGDFQSRFQQLGAHVHARLQTLPEHGAAQVTGRGLSAGVRMAPGGLTGREAAEALMARGVLCTPAHGMTLRIALPPIPTRSDLDLGLDAIIEVRMR